MSDKKEQAPGFADQVQSAARWFAARIINLALSVFFPFILMWVTTLVFPASKTIVNFTAYNTEASGALLAALVVAVVWLGLSLYFVVRGEAPIRFLQIEAVVSIIGFGAMMAYGGYLFKGAGIPYWYVVPFFASFIDGVGTAILAINNAGQFSTRARDRGPAAMGSDA